MKDLPDLSRTAAAIEAFDKHSAEFTVDRILRLTNREADQQLAKLEELAEAVGIAYGLDTADRNDPKTCAQCIRPGEAVPANGEPVSFVRRMLADWKSQPPVGGPGDDYNPDSPHYRRYNGD